MNPAELTNIKSDPVTRILLTVDTELSPAAHQRGIGSYDNYSSSILGLTSDGEWGVNYQIERLNAHGLKAVFFVEALCAHVFGLDLLKRIVEPILSGGHEVQLHIHTEWLPWFPCDPVGGRRGCHIADFDFHDQCRLLELGMEALVKAGAPVAVGFRAGNYGANNDTLRALASLGIEYDSSYNRCYVSNACRIITDGPLFDPICLDGVVELPIAFFTDYFRHYRPAQICANSIAELRFVIERSSACQRRVAVIVSHSFELLNRRRTKVNRLLLHRFNNLCELLSAAKTSAPTTGLTELDLTVLTSPSAESGYPLESHIGRTAWRMMEQGIGTFVYDRK